LIAGNGTLFAQTTEPGEKFVFAEANPREIPGQPPWWSGVVVDSVLGFSAMLVFVLGGVIVLRKWIRQRGSGR